MHSVRQPAVAGLFYPGSAQQLLKDVKQLLSDASQAQQHSPIQAKAIIVPHAGYIYSGSTAAKAFSALGPKASTIKRVVMVGPAHRVKLRGLAISDVQYFRTPLGDIPIDQEANSACLNLPEVQIMDSAHWQEHSLEVQLPFLQAVLEDFSLVPVIVGDSTSAEVQALLDLLWGGPETLIVISSDLSHFHDYSTAQYIDRSTCEAIEHFDLDHIDLKQACGSIGLKALLQAAKHRNMQVHTLGLCNSGDTSGDQERVVGYGSWAFTDKTQ
ncbi:AmmeMemoRadiSam system protein B [Oceanicoccus sagamiensis]|uniref:MEMO1 family protein BST96_19005 n=1 Tax=Oceanicoccus sagamiensis TaxID=716816 RepID=A0A1X9ND73_9GAMM|nr:AmmeMemoRadiSam system protein B [Oceanicoccus sagamiensis]ARN75998.1 AmmeMemoRadiSam system protein B [Oceanicoccus sagamiensis]